ncbi:MAG: radical SAM protein [Methylococcales bacterium]|nr:radical SAM protein [Methylococcales bacterium]
MMKTCLISPPHIIRAEDEAGPHQWPLLSMVTLGTILKNKNKPVELLDLQLLINKKILRFDRSFYKAAVKLIAASGADVLGFTAMCSNYPLALNLARECKRVNPRYKIIFGGPQATATGAESMRKFPFIDIVVYGEADVTLAEVIDRLEKGDNLTEVAGISYREGAKIVHNGRRELMRDLNELPLLDYGLAAPLSEYQGEQKSYVASIEVGRGCPYNCVYCSTSVHWGRKFRLKSAERIVAELTYLKKRYKIRTFLFQHDLFTLDRQRLRELCELMIGQKLGIAWTCSSRIDSLDVEDDTLALMARAGCKGIFYGVETGSERMQRLLNKNINLDRVEEVIKKTIKNDIPCAASFIIGFPEEKEADLNDTLNLALRLANIDYISKVQCNLIAPVAGTKLMADYKKDLIMTECISYYTSFKLCRSDEMKLIKENPELFSAFYNLKTRYVPLEVFIFAQDWGVWILKHLPKSLLLLCRELDMTPLKAIYLWIKWFNSNGYEITTTVSFTDAYNKYYKYVSGIYREHKKRSSFVRDLMKYEKSMNMIKLNKKKKIKGCSRTDLRQMFRGDWQKIVPAVSKQLISQTFSYDIEKYFSDNRKKNLETYNNQEKLHYLFYNLSDRLVIQRISEKTKLFLDKIDGERTFGEIIDDFNKVYPTPRSKIGRFLRETIKNGVINTNLG